VLDDPGPPARCAWVRALLLLLVPLPLIVGVTGAAADPRATFTELLRKGQRLEAAGDHAGAADVFQELVKLAPADPIALGELGWELFQTNQVAEAAAVTRRALAGKPTANHRAALLYNLGRMQESLGQFAQKSYAESLRLRWNPVVWNQLYTLAPDIANAIDPFTTRPLVAATSITAYCAAQPQASRYLGGDEVTCTCGERVKNEGAHTIAAPYLDVQLFTRNCGGDLETKLGVKLANGWYIAHIDSQIRNLHGSVNAAWKGFEIKDVVPGGEPELLIDYAPWTTYWHRADDLTTFQRALVVVGVGTSGVPAATRAIYLRERIYDGNTKRFQASDPDLAATWNPDGTLELAGATKQLDAFDPSLGGGLRGKHAIVFP